MINNYTLIAPLLNFTEPDDFYQLYVLLRKKDMPPEERDNHQSVRTLRTYCITSLEYLKKREAEIIDFCEHFRARAYIHVNKQNHKNISLLMLERLAQRIRSGHINQKGLFDSVVGELHSTEKRFIVDCDSKEKWIVDDMARVVNGCDPEGEKVIAVLPTKNGYHIIANRFNTKQFKESYPDVDLMKHNPCMYYLPNSLQ